MLGPGSSHWPNKRMVQDDDHPDNLVIKKAKADLTSMPGTSRHSASSKVLPSHISGVEIKHEKISTTFGKNIQVYCIFYSCKYFYSTLDKTITKENFVVFTQSGTSSITLSDIIVNWKLL